MGKLSFVQSNNGWVVVDLSTGMSYNFDSDHPDYTVLLQALTNDDVDTFIEHISIRQAVTAYAGGSGGDVVIDDGVIYLDGEPLHHSMTDRIIDNMRAGVPYENMLKFLANLMDNPSYKSREQLYFFLEMNGLPITADGHFLAYKTVRNNYKDKYTGKIDNSIGATPSMNRKEIDDDSSRTCSKGLHAGGLDYAGPGGWYNSDQDRVVIVKINPRDAVSVPDDHNRGKLRVCDYEVVGDYKGAMDKPCYDASGDELAEYQHTPEYVASQYLEVEDIRWDDNIEFTYRGHCRRGAVEDVNWTEEYDSFDDEYTDVVETISVYMAPSDINSGMSLVFEADSISEIKRL